MFSFLDVVQNDEHQRCAALVSDEESNGYISGPPSGAEKAQLGAVQQPLRRAYMVSAVILVISAISAATVATLAMRTFSDVMEDGTEIADMHLRKLADEPQDIVGTDLLAIHDLLMLGYYGVMTIGPHLRDQAAERVQSCKKNPVMTDFECMYIEKITSFNKEESEYEGLTQVRGAAVELAKLLPDLHPVESCRRNFRQNEAECSQDDTCDDEKLVEIQAAESWACINITEDMILPTCNGKDGCDPKDIPQPFTKFRDENGSLVQIGTVLPYRNFVLRDAPPLGACKQQWTPSSAPEGKTRWLRACSYWASFHTMALRADSLGQDKPNRLFGAIARIIAGGALWCGG